MIPPMGVKPEDLARVSAFRNQLVEYVNYLLANFDRYAGPVRQRDPPHRR